MLTTTDVIPAIDLAPFLDGSDKCGVARRIGAACETIGFLTIAGHGVARSTIDDAFAAARDFFDMAPADKARSRPTDKLAPRGFHPLASKTLARTIGQDTPPDLREQFYIGPLDPVPPRLAALPEAAPFYAPNIWPDRPASYRPAFTALYRALERLGADLMRSFALALDLDEHFFDDKIDHHFSTLPVNDYPVPERPALPGQLRAGAHSDFGSLTILLFDDAPGGLQVMTPAGTWQDVRQRRGEFVINLGDMMARWTNDRWKSTLHRVVNPPAELAAVSRRQSMGYFLHPNYDAEIACVASCRAPGEAPKYPPIRAGDQMRQKMERRL